MMPGGARPIGGRGVPIAGPIYVDVDGTLVVGGVLNRELVRYLEQRVEDGVELVLWSAQGGAYARRIAERHGVAWMFQQILGKPGFVVDDQGWSWTRWSRVLTPLDLEQALR